jgi:competence ComEA-like helix-hairpin-helix protein
MLILTPSERRAALVVVFLLMLGAARDLWRASHPRVIAPPGLAGQSLPGILRAGRGGMEEGAPGGFTPDALPVPTGAAGESGVHSTLSSPPDPPLDLNRATVAELDALPGVGPVLAGRIHDHRTKYGPFRSVDELLAVRGIGPRLLERVRSRVTVARQAQGR